jgi:hypothetical protein
MAVNPNTNFSTGQVLTASEQNRFPRGVMGYYVATGNSAVTTATAQITGTTITWTAEANRLYRAQFTCDYSQNTANAIIGFYLADSAGTTFYNAIANTVSVANGFAQISLTHLFTVSAGSTTRKIMADLSSGTATVRGTGGGGGAYTFIIEDMGPA